MQRQLISESKIPQHLTEFRYLDQQNDNKNPYNILKDIMSDDIEQIYQGLVNFEIKLNTIQDEDILRLLIPSILQIFLIINDPLFQLQILNYYLIEYESEKFVQIFLENEGANILLRKLKTTGSSVRDQIVKVIGQLSKCSIQFAEAIVDFEGIVILNKLLLSNAEEIVLKVLPDIFDNVRKTRKDTILSSEIIPLISSCHQVMEKDEDSCKYSCKGIVSLIRFNCAHENMVIMANHIMTLLNNNKMENLIEYLLEPITSMLVTSLSVYIDNLSWKFLDLIWFLLQQNINRTCYFLVGTFGRDTGRIQLDIIQNKQIVTFLFLSIQYPINNEESRSYFSIINKLTKDKLQGLSYIYYVISRDMLDLEQDKFFPYFTDEYQYQRIDCLTEQGLFAILMNKLKEKQFIQESLQIIVNILQAMQKYYLNQQSANIPNWYFREFQRLGGENMLKEFVIKKQYNEAINSLALELIDLLEKNDRHFQKV